MEKNSFCGCSSYLPTFDGNKSFAGFWMQFSIFADRHQWNNEDIVCNLCLSLRGKALEYASYLPSEIRSDSYTFYSSLKYRFGDMETPEMSRIRLRKVKKLEEESIQEYICRVEIMVRKSFPGIDNELHVRLTTEYSLYGYPDYDIALEVLTKHPLTVSELIREIMWQEHCKVEFHTETSKVATEHHNEEKYEQRLNYSDIHNLKTKINSVKTIFANRKCSRCKSFGHIRRICPQRKLVQSKTETEENTKCEKKDLNCLWLSLMVNSQPVM